MNKHVRKNEIETTLVNAGKLNENFKTLKECFDRNNNLMQTHLSQIDSLKKSIRYKKKVYKI